MSDVMHGIDEDVPFDNAAADALIATCNGAASAIEGQAGSRASYVRTGMTDFAGLFSQLFQTNASTASADATELAERLRQVATGAKQLKDAAAAEQKRRETARKWKHDQDNRSLWDKGVDSVFGEDKPPVGPPDPPVSIPVTPSRSGTRQNPQPGSGGGGGGGTSSARPADLRTFATSSSHANTALQPKESKAKADLTHFVATCKWGTLSADGVMTGFSRWLAANAEDVKWANTVAAAFDRAGSSGGVSTLSDSALAASLKAAGVNASRQDLTIPGPMAVGHPPTTGYAVDPVNTSTGNFVETETDLAFDGGCAELEVSRTYNSLGEGVGGFGPGWASWTEAGLHVDDEAAHLVLPDGRNLQFPRLGSGWDRATGENMWLVAADGDDGYLATDNEGTRWVFSRAGRLTRRDNGAGTAVRLTWDDARLVRMDHERGRGVELTWTGDGDTARVSGLHASDGRTVTYAYDEHDRLVSATTALGTRTYRWDDASGLVSAVVAASGVTEAENVYDDQGRVVQQRTAHGRLVRFVYLPGRVTEVSDEDGTRANTWIADERGRLVGVVDADEQRQSMAYDKHGNQVLATERDGATTVREYDERGRLARWVTPSSADFRQTWDDQDRLTGVSVLTEPGEAPAVTTYEYSGDDRQPCLLTDPEGGTTRMSWSAGLLTEVVDPTGVVVRFTHDEHGDLVATTDADGNVARLERDTTGRVVAAVTPSGARTRFAYDARTGQLVRRVDPDGAVWSFEHTPDGRVAAVVDPLGGRTEMEHGPEGEVTTSIDPLGRAVSRHFDDLGNLASVELPDGSAWRFEHDAMSRLRETVAPDGARSRFDYDATGVLNASTGPCGEQISAVDDDAARATEVVAGPMTAGIRVDRLGRLVASEAPDGSTVLTRYDRCGRPVELVDGDGGLTSVTRDAAGRPVAVTHPGGGVVHYEYDACGRAVAVVDALGARSTMTYDADGRRTSQVGPTGDAGTWEYDACGRVVKARIPGFGTSTWSFDAAGRVVETRDPQLGRRHFRYDAAGQLVEAVAGNGGVTRYDYDVNGRAVLVTDPAGGETRRTWDSRNHLVAETDPLGRTTEAGYDASGRQVWQTAPDGRRTEWTYDETGRVASVLVDGEVVSSIVRDLRGRRVRIADHRTDGATSVHELVWDSRGNLVSRTRDGRGLAWTYDADGRRTSRTGPDGDTTRYERDAGGRLTAVDHPLLGRASFSHDQAGRVVAAEAGGLRQTWTYADGFTTAHRVSDGDRASETLVDRDEVGRVVSVHRDGTHTTYDYDEACQLVAARTSGADGTATARWRYDAAGRLVAESRDGSVRELSYDAAGQLVATHERDGRTLDHVYDDLGRRTRVSASDGSTRSFGWSRTGWLESVADRAADGTERRVTATVDALGELARLDDAEVFFDTAEPYSPSLAHLGGAPVLATGVATGVGDDWLTPGWRGVRTDAADPGDPWGTAAPGVGAAGELGFAGLEWLGARVYDPAARGFLSVDPLDAVPGAGWAGNPYSYAGNDPLHAADPTGMRPATDADLKAYAAAHSGTGFGKWVKNNWEYVAGGAMVLAGGVLIATGVGGPAGMMLVSAGADTIIQKATTGHVNWGEVAVSGALGGIGGAGIAAKAGLTGFKATVVAGAASGGISGAGTSAYGYMSGPGPHSVGGLLKATGEGGAAGVVLGGAGGAAGHGLTTVGGRVLDNARGITRLNPTDVRFSQSSVNGVSKIEQNMRVHGYSPARAPIDVVRMPDGELTTVDNSRVLAAHNAGSDLRVRVHEHGDAIPDGRADTLVSKKGSVPSTWGEGVENRIGNQNSGYRTTYPQGSPVIGWNGS